MVLTTRVLVLTSKVHCQIADVVIHSQVILDSRLVVCKAKKENKFVLVSARTGLAHKLNWSIFMGLYEK